MVSLRKASSYSKKGARPYTRVSRNKSKAYIKVVPHNKLVKYSIGNVEAFNKSKLKHWVRFISDERIVIRDNALESARMFLTKVFDTKLPKQYYFEVRVHPHHILRNNKTAAGAGADRLSSGMSHSFGSVEGRAAIVQAGKEIFFVACETEQGARIAREALTAIKAKMPCRSRIFTERVQ